MEYRTSHLNFLGIHTSPHPGIHCYHSENVDFADCNERVSLLCSIIDTFSSLYLQVCQAYFKNQVEQLFFHSRVVWSTISRLSHDSALVRFSIEFHGAPFQSIFKQL